ncbi:MAG: hypoxanthine phosphoribosyltransferase [Ruminococcaceae bacterium]|nr:hypoxanthine phosphoribosyltransferase [Oscillospiraceae bacterium]
MRKDIESILINEDQISEICDRIAAQISKDYENSEKKLVLVCILKGSLMFTSELMKRINIPVEMEFMKASSYGSKTVSSGIINIHLDIKRDDMENVDFIIIEDIIDSGNTLSHLVRYLKERGAASVKTCTMLDKPERRTVEFTPDYIGMEIPDKFVVGFGLDYNEKYRNLPYVGVLKPEIYSH